MPRNLVDTFEQHFEMLPADTEHLKELAYRLRYQIFCIETGLQNKDDFPDGLQIDEYDEHSEHYLIRHRKTGLYAATTRLILQRPNQHDFRFPMEMICRIDHSEILNNTMRNRLGEASRFCVSDPFKRRTGEQGTVDGVGRHGYQYYIPSLDKRREFPHVMLALLACLIRMSLDHGITHWLGLMEASLTRLLRMFGIRWTRIGPITNYYGMRQPCIIELEVMLQEVKKASPEVWMLLTDCGRRVIGREGDSRKYNAS